MKERIKGNEALFYTLPESKGFGKFITMAEHIKEQTEIIARSNPAFFETALDPLVNELNMHFDSGQIDRKLVYKLGHIHAKKDMEAALNLVKARNMMNLPKDPKQQS